MCTHSTSSAFSLCPGDALGRGPTMDGVMGAVMIADITGFTPLTERALTSKRGTELVEELTHAMNSYFDETLASCVLRAVGCGFDLVSTLGVFTPQLGGYGDTSCDSDNDLRDLLLPRSAAQSSRGIRIKQGSELVSVLVVDDIMLNRVVLSKMLSKLTCKVVLAVNGKEAVTAYSRNPFELIFMDLHMPIMDGYKATQMIRQVQGPAFRDAISHCGLVAKTFLLKVCQDFILSRLHITSDLLTQLLGMFLWWPSLDRSKTLIIGVCSRYDEELKKECLNAGMDDLLMKPVTMSQLVTVLRSLTVIASNQEGAPPKDSAVAENVARRNSSREISLSNDVVSAENVSKEKKFQPKKISMRKMALNQPSPPVIPDAPLTLTLKVLIGFGKVCMLSVGGGIQLPSGQPRWEYFMADMPVSSDTKTELHRYPIEQLRCCEEHAKSGNVIISPEAWSLVKEECEGKVLERGFVQLSRVVGHINIPSTGQDLIDVTLLPRLIPKLERYLPEVLRSKIEATPGTDNSLRSEVRHVTCLFLGFPSWSSVDLGKSRLLDSIQAAILTVQHSLRVHGGLLAQFRMDEKGDLFFLGRYIKLRSHGIL